MARKNAEERKEADFADAVADFEERIRDLQRRLTTPVSDPAVDELEIELQKYFSRETAAEVQDLRRRVADGVVDKIMREWEQSHDDVGLEEMIIDRLVERIHERLAAKTTSGSRNREF